MIFKGRAPQNRPKIDPGGAPKIKLQKKRQKSEGWTPKSGFLGPGVDFGISPGASQNAFCRPQIFFGDLDHPSTGCAKPL